MKGVWASKNEGKTGQNDGVAVATTPTRSDADAGLSSETPTVATTTTHAKIDDETSKPLKTNENTEGGAFVQKETKDNADDAKMQEVVVADSYK